MEEKPGSGSESPEYASCPYCTLQVRVGDPVCPHCRRPLAPSGEEEAAAPIRRPLRTVGRLPEDGFWVRYGKWIKAAAPIVLALVVLVLIYQRWVGVRISVTPNPSLPVKATLEKRGAAVVVRGTVTNEGDDVPDLSMKSIGVMVEFVYRDGRRYRKRIFPKTGFRGEGALLRGETGAFEIEAPKAALEEVRLTAEVVDLAGGRDLSPPGGTWRIVPEGR
ncbi:MAG: hypothetical protein ACM3NF_04985 [Gemmatimonadota bacterium]